MINYEWSIIKIGNGRKLDLCRIIENVKLKIEKMDLTEFMGLTLSIIGLSLINCKIWNDFLLKSQVLAIEKTEIITFDFSISQWESRYSN